MARTVNPLQLAEQLAALDSMSKDELAVRWVKLTGRSAPRLSVAMLRLAVGYEMQAKSLGGLPRKLRQRLEQIVAAKTTTSMIRPGMRLAREHGGKVHVVTVGDGGEIVWNGREWKSLSEVARAITGTRWSGPAFFGLKGKGKAA